jgi:hypothetical protein
LGRLEFRSRWAEAQSVVIDTPIPFIYFQF